MLPSIRVWPLLLLFSFAGIVGCVESPYDTPDYGEPISRDLPAIQERDTLVALTTYNSTSYFLYRGQPMGYEYGMLRAFADAHDLALRMEVVEHRDSLYHFLNRGRGDVVAARAIPATRDSAQIGFTVALYETPPALVQRKARSADVFPQATDSLIADEDGTLPERVVDSRADSIPIRARLIQRPAGLAGEEVHLPSNSAYTDQLLELSDQLTGDIAVVEADGVVTAESLIRAVSLREIDLTVSQANLAKLKESYYTNLVVRPTMGPPDNIAWAVRKNAPQLQDTLNAWLRSEDAQRHNEAMYEKYFVDRKGYRERIADDYLTSETGMLSPYDSLLQVYADTVGWDWRLLASQAYQESRFQPRARSWAGAAGLLQLMPRTARQWGVRNVYDPEQNIAGAARHIEWLQNYWDEKVSRDEHLKFVLASYNTGHGHVQDARRLTRKYGDDPNTWDDVAYWLLQKSKRQYYTDPVVQYGYARGLEPVTYVSRILDRFEHYKQFVIPSAAPDVGEEAQIGQAVRPAPSAPSGTGRRTR